jgi:hypothetical protein
MRRLDFPLDNAVLTVNGRTNPLFRGREALQGMNGNASAGILRASPALGSSCNLL